MIEIDQLRTVNFFCPNRHIRPREGVVMECLPPPPILENRLDYPTKTLNPFILPPPLKKLRRPC